MAQPKGEGSIIRLEGTSKADCRLWRLRFNMDDGTRRERRFREATRPPVASLSGSAPSSKAPRKRSRPATRSRSTPPIGWSCAGSRATCARKPS